MKITSTSHLHRHTYQLCVIQLNRCELDLISLSLQKEEEPTVSMCSMNLLHNEELKETTRIHTEKKILSAPSKRKMILKKNSLLSVTLTTKKSVEKGYNCSWHEGKTFMRKSKIMDSKWNLEISV